MKYKVLQDGDFFRIQIQFNTPFIFTSQPYSFEEVTAETERLRKEGFQSVL